MAEKYFIYVIAPVLNEAENMPTLVQSWKKLSEEISQDIKFILVDDGSTDNTADRANEGATKVGLSLQVLRHERNQGPGAAFGTAFAHLASIIQSKDIVVTMEGDNTSRANTLITMIGRLDREGVQVAFASPYAYGGGIQNTSLLRVLMSHIANGMIKSFLDIHGIHTMSSFFRAYRGDVILSLQKKWGPRILDRKGFECMVELTKKIILGKNSITEVPMSLDTSLRKGKSKMKVLRTIRGYFAVIWEARKWDIAK